MNIEIIAGLIILAGSIGILLAKTFTHQEKKKSADRANKPPQQDILFKKLLTKAQGDHGKANRLIEFERRKKPTASKFELTKAAIERLERDMGR